MPVLNGHSLARGIATAAGHLSAQIAICILFLAFGIASAAAQTIPGTRIDNVASVTYSVDAVTQPTITSLVASVMVVPVPSPSTIEFLRYAPGTPTTQPVQVNGSDYSPSGNLAGPFVALGTPLDFSGNPIDLSTPVDLAPAANYTVDESVFVRVTDASGNLDGASIDVVVITLTTSSGDQEILRLYETDVNTGVFAAFIFASDSVPPVLSDGNLTVTKNELITALYVDIFDNTDISTTSALVDPFGRVFDSQTGDYINGVSVTLIDDSTGLPANVFGIDGVSTYPNTVISGTGTTDTSGRSYTFDPGEFRFPVVAPGNYRLDVTPPTSYIMPSTVSDAQLQTLVNAPYVLMAGSRGGVFSVPVGPAVQVDVPLDPRSTLFVTKTASAPTAAMGDFLKYSLSVFNGETTSVADVVLTDTLPLGLRFQPGSLRINGVTAADPAISPDGSILSIDMGTMASGQRDELSYVVGVSAGVKTGNAVNRAIAIAPGGFRSNEVAAVVRIVEDLFQSFNIIVGRVAAQACDESTDWAREVTAGVGVEGVRLYMEDGTYVITDENGLYHLEGVKPGVHVIQVDQASLPNGYVPMFCEENNRFAGRPYSRFVDVQPGKLWRVNFYLKKTAEAIAEEKTAAAAEAAKTEAEDLDVADIYGVKWLHTQDTSVQWVFPDEGHTPRLPAIDVGIKHKAGDKVVLMLNGQEISVRNIASSDRSRKSKAALTRYKGVDIAEGINKVVAIVKDANGVEKGRIERDVAYINKSDRAAFVPEASSLIADGRTPPVIAIRLTDSAGHPLHPGAVVELNVLAPYSTLQAKERFEQEALTTTSSVNAGMTVGENGILKVQLEPTLKSGRALVIVKTNNGEQEVRAWLKPEMREWIVVGLAEGTAGYNTVTGNSVALNANDAEKDSFTDGRIAFFAKGMIQGKWLLTLKVDTDQHRGATDDELFQKIDPNKFYTLYGDASEQDYEAESQYPVYVKLEREQFYALFGDFHTEMDRTQLARYNRRLSGLKTAYEGERFSVLMFGAETNQGFVKDEILADGTTGPFYLKTVPLIRNSETLIVETRDRFRADVVLATTRLTRFTDYSIDYDTGEIIFRRPIAATDLSFNPSTIIVDYEVEQATERHFTYGGRAAVRFADDRAEVGVSYIHEGGSTGAADTKSDLVAVDAKFKLGENTELRAEVATSRTTSSAGETKGDAMLAELTHYSEDWNARLHYRQEDAGFGLGQLQANTSAKRRYGVSASYVLVRNSGEEGTILPGTLTANASAYHEDDLVTGATRNVGEVTLAQSGSNYEVSAGLRYIEDELATGLTASDLQGIISGSYPVLDGKLVLRASYEQSLSNDETSNYPTRLLLGADYRVTDWATFSLSQEFAQGLDYESQNTSAALRLSPWDGGTINLGGDRRMSENGERIAATAGVAQTVKITDKISASIGGEHRRTVSETPTQFDSLTFSSATLAEDYTLGYIGLSYSEENWGVSGRLEYRDTDPSDRVNFTLGAAGDITDATSMSTYFTARQTTYETGEDDTEVELRLSAAHRPHGIGVVILDRLDLNYSDDTDDIKTFKVVNNLAANIMLTRQTQLSVQYGAKYVQTDIDGATYDGFSQIAGFEVRHDISKKWDVGAHATARHTLNESAVDYSAGASVGYSPFDNTWLSLGYNISGFRDEDFAAAEFTQQGPYVRFRMKFDENSLGDVLKQFDGQ